MAPHLRAVGAGALRDNAYKHLLNLDALDQLDLLTRAVRAFAARTGRLPRTLGELPGINGRPPLDPAGTPFRYDARTGKVDIDPASGAWKPT